MRHLDPRPLAACLGLALALALQGCASGPDPVRPGEREIAFQERLAPEDGAIVSVLGVRVDTPYGDLTPSTMARHGEEIWERARAGLTGRADLVTYSSDGLRIGGFLVRPEGIEGRRLGAVIVNRDGLAGRGLDENEILVELSRYADAGYVAAASAYRGNRLSGGVDELGGDDVNDVLALVALVRRLDYVDPARVFMVGFGRGGLMTYRAIEEGAPVRAAAVISGVSDVSALLDADRELERGFEDSGGWPGLAAIHGEAWDGPARDAELERRSPGRRAEAMAVPLLVVHGRLDDVVPVEQAEAVATGLRASGTPVETLIYGYGDHGLLEQQDDWRARVMAWLDRHDKRALFN